jgi:predicted Zn-dependent protease
MPLRVQAFAAQSEAEYEQAVAALKRALESQPRDDALRAELAGVHMRFNRFNEARQELVTILSHNPMISADCWLNLRTVYRRLGDAASAATAENQFRRIIALKTEATDLQEQFLERPQDAHLALRLSNTLLKLGKVEDSFVALNRAVSVAPADPEVQRALSAAKALQRSRQ